MDKLTVEEAHKVIIAYITQNPGMAYKDIAGVFGYTPQYIGKLAIQAGLPPRIGSKRLSKVPVCVREDLLK